MATIVYSCQGMQNLSDDLVGTGVQVRRIDWKTFKDGYPDLIIPDVHEIRGNDVVFLASMENPQTIFEQLSVIYAIPRYGARSLTIVLPYFPTATKDRVDEEGEICTAKTLARMFSATPLSMHGPARLVMFDIHALQERFYFEDTIIPQMATAIPLLKKQLETDASIAIAFPDEGAWKRFHRFFEDYPQIICHKVRQGDERIVTIKEGNPRGYHVVIVDDLVMTGGTLDECRKVCIEAGAKTVSAFVTHPVFPQESWKRFTGSGPDQFKNFWITDSCPDTIKAINHAHPFKLLPLTQTIRDIIDSEIRH
ncbi:MAG: ribose-phosphate diphosphokinase [Chloroflexi bacterium]|jgi:ribose-phosphate pyrophosphokinase|nr:ribose-phosphate diphosphokinase [Candidatus Parcubacteria bacterium]MBT7082135.1 ribose-phosphate diphosphokinase [Chloroflexota bacterium]